MSMAAGWYQDNNGAPVEWYYDGNAYTGASRPAGAPAAAGPLYSFAGTISGKKTHLDIFADRIERRQHSGVSAGKITAGIFTGGMSLAMTGVGKGTYGANVATGAEVIRLESVTGVASRKEGGDWVVAISTPRSWPRCPVPTSSPTSRSSLICDTDDSSPTRSSTR